jgi:hypothetical protein
MAITRAVLKVRGLSLLLRVGTLWRYGDGLLFEVPPLASGALRTTLQPVLVYFIKIAYDIIGHIEDLHL